MPSLKNLTNLLFLSDWVASGRPRCHHPDQVHPVEVVGRLMELQSLPPLLGDLPVYPHHSMHVCVSVLL